MMTLSLLQTLFFSINIVCHPSEGVNTCFLSTCKFLCLLNLFKGKHFYWCLWRSVTNINLTLYIRRYNDFLKFSVLSPSLIKMIKYVFMYVGTLFLCKQVISYIFTVQRHKISVTNMGEKWHYQIPYDLQWSMLGHEKVWLET